MTTLHRREYIQYFSLARARNRYLVTVLVWALVPGELHGHTFHIQKQPNVSLKRTHVVFQQNYNKNLSIP